MRGTTRATILGVIGFALVAVAFLAPTVAFAGRSSTGDLAFFPCTRCHPVTVGADGKPSRPLPNGFKEHEITLEVHSILGDGDKACLACHDDPSRNPGMLKLADGSLIDIKGDISRVCQRCHFEKYREFTTGVHGKHKDSCTAQGCHDPHTPSWIYVEPLGVFQRTGFEVHAVGEREAFTPFAPPPVPPAVMTPLWLKVMASLGAFAALGITGLLISSGRSKR